MDKLIDKENITKSIGKLVYYYNFNYKPALNAACEDIVEFHRQVKALRKIIDDKEIMSKKASDQYWELHELHLDALRTIEVKDELMREALKILEGENGWCDIQIMEAMKILKGGSDE